MSAQTKPLKIPKRGASADEIEKFLDRVCDRESSKRRELELEWLENKAYLEGFQWLQRNKGSTRNAPRFTTPTRTDIPMPVTNEILGPVDNEVARLSKRNSETYVDPSDQSPGSKAGAKLANDVSQSHFREMRWSRIRRKGLFQDVLYGTMIQTSFLEMDNLDTVKVGVLSAQKCCGGEQLPTPEEVETAAMLGLPAPLPTPTPPCGCSVAKSEIPESKIMGLRPDVVRERPSFVSENVIGKKYEISGCPSCGGKLQPFIPTLEEAHGKDYFDRPLGQDIPRGCAKIVARPVTEFYPANEGMGQDPETLEWFAFACAKSVDWVKRYHRKNTDKVEREEPDVVAEVAPILGEYAPEARGNVGVADRPVFQDHVRYREFYSMPTMEYPKGRAIAMAGRVVVMDDDMMIDPDPVDGKLPGKPFPRVKVGIARCFPKDGEIWGQGAPVHAKSLQNRINMTNSQVVDRREHAVGGIMATRGMKLVREWVRGFAGYIFRYDADPAAKNLKPEAFAAGVPDPEAIKEIEYATDRISAILGTMGVETGGVPAPGVTAASAIQFSAEKAAERRQQREKEIIDAFEEVFEHQLKLIQKYYREPREYQIEAAGGAKGWEKREFVGSEINGETGIKIREQPAFDVKMAEREALWQMAQAKIIPLDTPYQRREFGKIMGAPISILESEDIQFKAAGRKWFNFLREGIVPPIYPNLDDHAIHLDEYGRQLLSDDGVELTQKSQWDVLNAALWGWQEDLQKATDAITQAKAAGWKPGMPFQQMFNQAAMAAKANYDRGAQMLQQAQANGAQPIEAPPPPPPPTQFPNPTNPPEPLPDLIMWVWDGRFIERGIQPTPEQRKFAQFQAVYEAHHLLAEAERTAEMAGQVQAPAPGTASPEMAA